MMYDWVDVTVKVPGFAQRVLLLSTAAHSDSTSYQTWVGQSVATVKRSKFSSPQLAVPLTRRWLTLRPPIRCCSAESRRILPGWPRPRATSRCPPARATRRACSPRRRLATHWRPCNDRPTGGALWAAPPTVRRVTGGSQAVEDLCGDAERHGLAAGAATPRPITHLIPSRPATLALCRCPSGRSRAALRTLRGFPAPHTP